MTVLFDREGGSILSCFGMQGHGYFVRKMQ
jgi:hypothetical protein